MPEVPPEEHPYTPPLRLFRVLRYLVPSVVTVGVGLNAAVLGVDTTSFFVGLGVLFFGFQFGFYFRDRLQGRYASALGSPGAEPGNPSYMNDISDWLHLGFSAALCVGPFAWLLLRSQ